MITQQLILSKREYHALLREDFGAFLVRAFYELNPQQKFVPGHHIEVIASKLTECQKKKIRRLIINLPPRSLKSHCVTVAFTAWLLGKNPAANIISASYGQDLSDSLARDTRSIMNSNWYKEIFGTRIVGSTAVHDFSTNGGGGRLASSVGGSLTGRGADFIILDDPLKPEDALSETQRPKTNEWYDSTLVSRLNDKQTDVIIIVMQRLHQDDLVGHVLKQEDWDVLAFPAIAETAESHLITSPLGNRIWRRKPGDVLQPERETRKTLEEIRRRTGEYNFEAQYQQRPTPPGGAMVRTAWLKYYDATPARFGCIYQSWDTANKAGQLNDYSVCTTWGVSRDDLFLLDVYRKKVNFPELFKAVVALRNKYRPHVLLVEDKASGTPLVQELRRTRINVQSYLPPAGTDKIMRLHAQTTYFENGRIFLRRHASWVSEYVAELTGFPGTRYDDQVDSTTQVLDYHGKHASWLHNITPEVLSRVRAHKGYSYPSGLYRPPSLACV